MKDQFTRTIDYIRISLTDKCNLRCLYCMPQDDEQPEWNEDVLTSEELITLCRHFADVGIKKIKLTGGEPLLRKDIVWLVKELYAIKGIEDITLTTNGMLLDEKVEALYESGIRHINVSLDTIHEEEFYKITRRKGVDKVIQGIHHALQLGMHVKLNVVPMRLNEQHIMELLVFAKDYPIHIRFIEMMPIGLGKDIPGIPQEEMMHKIETMYGKLQPVHDQIGYGPSVYYHVEGFKGHIGFISALSHKFCSSCNRVRLTSDGFLKGCLQYNKGIHLKEIVRSKDEALLKEKIMEAIYRKPKAHAFEEEDVEHVENREQKLMSGIGG